MEASTCNEHGPKNILQIGCYDISTSFDDNLEVEQKSFFGFTHQVAISRSTAEAVEQLESAVWQRAHGDRRVRRYFDAYDTPFAGQGRRSEI